MSRRPQAETYGHAKESQTPALPEPENLLPAPALPPPPEHLGPVGLRVWSEVWQAGAGAYNVKTDVYIIERYATFQERRWRLMEIINDEGVAVIGSKGQLVQHPAARLLHDVEAKLTTLEDRLGLNPEARLRLGIAAVEHKSKLDAFLEEPDASSSPSSLHE